MLSSCESYLLEPIVLEELFGRWPIPGIELHNSTDESSIFLGEFFVFGQVEGLL